ncbi:MAG TPA: glucose-6-phosphate dehydrogenase [Bryobacteraceae bacterium]|nr:glucose-6-phosphate dehydrogenase [Bryobacteraceae bacterium]
MSVVVQAPPEVNPLEDALRFERRVPPCAVVIFGASGDLSKRKLLPSLYRLFYERRISPDFAVIGSSRTPMSDDAFREKMKESVSKFLEDAPFDEDVWKSFAQSLFYVPGDLNVPSSYDDIRNRLDEVEKSHRTAGNVLFYLSTQPSHYAEAILELGAHQLNKGHGWRRVIIEKPFGHDLASARKLNDEIHKVFDESAIYRIDHYLGKETVQNILAFRFGNGIFEPLWNRRYVDHIQITAAESIGVEGRGAYYQEAGALRDMIQNHLSQVMATVMMEPPTIFDATNVRDERAKLLRAVRVMKHDDVPKYAVAGQYGPAFVGGEQVAGFRQEPSVSADAQTDTYAAVTFFIDNWRWAGTPVYIRTGKRMPKRVTDIAIQFKAPPLGLFQQETKTGLREVRPNLLVLRIQPEEGISLRFLSKSPGSGMRVRPVSMDFNYGSSFGERSPTAYETLLLDAMMGDPTLYTRQDMVEASWQIVQPILEVWENSKFFFPNYPAGSWGPKASDDMLAQQGHVWRIP